MVNYNDIAMLFAGIIFGRLLISPTSRWGIIPRLLAAYPCYSVIWFEIDKIFRFKTIEISSADQIIVYFIGVGMIWGAATKILPMAVRAARVLVGCLMFKVPQRGRWALRTTPIILIGMTTSWLLVSTIADAHTIASETLIHYLTAQASPAP